MSTPPVPLHHLPSRTLGAAANMAVDTLLLEAYPEPASPRFRHYGWAEPAFTFGRTQPYAQARLALPVHISWQEAHQRFADAFSLVRRPTGGGIVDHRSDWTYALVIPAGHPLCAVPARDVYRETHLIIAAVLAEQGVTASLCPCAQETCATAAPAAAAETAECSADCVEAKAKAADASDSNAAPASSSASTEEESAEPQAAVCFNRAEVFDLVSEDGEKLAGAAQKRNRHGLLVQGSLNRAAIGGINWKRFEQDLAEEFALWLAVEDVRKAQLDDRAICAAVREVAFPKWTATQLQAEIDRYKSTQWNERR